MWTQVLQFLQKETCRWAVLIRMLFFVCLNGFRDRLTFDPLHFFSFCVAPETVVEITHIGRMLERFCFHCHGRCFFGCASIFQRWMGWRGHAPQDRNIHAFGVTKVGLARSTNLSSHCAYPSRRTHTGMLQSSASSQPCGIN